MKDKSLKYSVFIGRFQPFHNSHKKVIIETLKEVDRVIVIIGSVRTTITVKNPWTFEERKKMIQRSFEPEIRKKLIIIGCRDYTYAMQNWISGVQAEVGKLGIPYEDMVQITGCYKDDTSFYLKCFPQWNPVIKHPNYDNINGTDIRAKLFEADSIDTSRLPSAVVEQILKWSKTKVCKDLKEEYKFIIKYTDKWKDAPYTPTFVTTDAVVTQSGHVLVVKRGLHPGKGLYALPGGFVNTQEKIKTSCYRELIEETQIKVPKPILMSSIVKKEIFDHPKRDPRGRFITHAYHFQLDDTQPLPHVTGGDDAAEALWMSYADLRINEDKFFADHIHIITHFIKGV